MTIYSERTGDDVETVLEAAPLAPMWHPGSPRTVQSGMPLMEDMDDRDHPDLLIGVIADDSLAPPLVPNGYLGSAGRENPSPVGDHHYEADLQSPPTLVHDLLSTPWLAWRTYPRIGLVGGMALGVSAAAALAFVVVKNFPVQRAAAGPQSAASAANATPGTPEARLAGSPAGAVGTGWSRTAPPPQLIATTSGGQGADEPLPLGLALRGEPAGAVLMINGLPQGAALSRGKRASATGWRLDPSSELDDVAVRPPARFSGVMNLTAELVLNGETVDRRGVRLEWGGARTAQAPGRTGPAPGPLPQAVAGRPPTPAPSGPAPAAAKPQRPTTAVAPAGATSDLAGPPTGAVEPRDKDVDALIARGQRLMRAKDIASARQVLQRAADSGDARVALSLGETYDPVMLERLGVRGVGDIEQARAWYARAQGLGSTEAPRRLKLLATR